MLTVLKDDALTAAAAAAAAGEALVVVVDPETTRVKRLHAAVRGSGIAVVAVVLSKCVVGRY